MNTGELEAMVAKQTGLGKTQAKSAVTAILHTIQSEVRKGNRVTIAGFGSFTQAKRKARTGRNPRTGEKVKITAKKVPKFSAGRVFKEVVSKKRKLKAMISSTVSKKVSSKKAVKAKAKSGVTKKSLNSKAVKRNKR